MSKDAAVTKDLIQTLEDGKDGFAKGADKLQGDEATGTTQQAASSAQSAMGSAASAVGDVVTSAPQAVEAQTQGNPLAAGLVAFGLGALAGTLVPTTRREEQAVAQVQPALETAAGELAESAQSVAASAKDHAAEGAEHVKEAVRGAAETVKADARDATENTEGSERAQ